MKCIGNNRKKKPRPKNPHRPGPQKLGETYTMTEEKAPGQDIRRNREICITRLLLKP